MPSIQFLKRGSSLIIITSRNFLTFPFPYAGNLMPALLCSSALFYFHVLSHDQFLSTFSNHFSNRLIVTDSAQCGAWSAWAAANKRSRNARISHAENPSNSDAVEFFFHTLSVEPYCQFLMKEQLYTHFEKLLSTADKQLTLNDQNFAAKVNPRRAYPECTVNTGLLFDEDGDPIFNIEVASTPVSPDATAGKARKGKGAKKTGDSLKRTLGTSSSRRKKSKKTKTEVDATEIPPAVPVIASVLPTPTVTAALDALQVVTAPAPSPTRARQPKLFRYPSLLALPSKTAIPRHPSATQFLSYSFLPTSSLKGNSLFNAFISYVSNCENNCVLVSRAFASNTITQQGSQIAIRQVLSICSSPSTFTH